MKKIAFLLLLPVMAMAQEKPATVAPKQTGKYDTNKFSQMYDLLATPNMYRSASGAPGPAYYQQQADAQMQSVDNTYMRENDPRMPMFKERKSTVTFGKGT